MDSQHEEDQKKAIRRNLYTRGQIDLFIAAENRYGLNEITEWMKYGVDAVLNQADLNNLRNVDIPARTPTAAAGLPSYAVAKAAAPDTLVLRGISWTQIRPLAVINNRTFAIKERGSVRVGTTNLIIRCLEISTNSAVVQIDGRTGTEVLLLPEK